jgi:hypothetical protein
MVGHNTYEIWEGLKLLKGICLGKTYVHTMFSECTGSLIQVSPHLLAGILQDKNFVGRKIPQAGEWRSLRQQCCPKLFLESIGDMNKSTFTRNLQCLLCKAQAE